MENSPEGPSLMRNLPLFCFCLCSHSGKRKKKKKRRLKFTTETKYDKCKNCQLWWRSSYFETQFKYREFKTLYFTKFTDFVAGDVTYLKREDEVFAVGICRRVPAAFETRNLHSNISDAPSVQMSTLFFVHCRVLPNTWHTCIKHNICQSTDALQACCLEVNGVAGS
jgi:hypothetical protein